jgi:hypothetical protein
LYGIAYKAGMSDAHITHAVNTLESMVHACYWFVAACALAGFALTFIYKRWGDQ